MVTVTHESDAASAEDGLPARVPGAAGKFALKNRPVKTAGVTETDCELHDNPFGPIHVVGFNGVFLVVVKTTDGKEMYGI